MKIAIPVDEKCTRGSVSLSFGRAPYFLIYDIESKESVFMENSALKNQGGAGIKAAQLVVDSKAAALIAPRCGENAAKVLKGADIILYKTIDGSVEDNIRAFVHGDLSFLEEIHGGFHDGGGK